MDSNFLQFVTKLTVKRHRKNNDDTKDIIQESLIQLWEKGINQIEDNELKINHIIVYNINKFNRIYNNNKIITVDNNYYFDSKQDLNPPTKFDFNIDKIYDMYSEFLAEYGNDFIDENLRMFYSIKFEKASYKELGKDTPTNRKKVSDIYIAFKNYLFEKNIELTDFFDEI
ncbi:hypothetical protein SYJ56_07970 [Algoriphagus sp. D3-2-R+10]|uniref:hypothetical protein n=1 Tax=Algoriphagus aurantiacus TaxID=3103948 RepID=UPI002B397F2F|nr:hypothetical protein [Algoriphagus sp. D3-2-R+10]MEB2775241.1 hypothetical protein [Algoriphagus sp. D3-2-R+10]